MSLASKIQFYDLNVSISKKIPLRFSEYYGRVTEIFLSGDIDTFRIYTRNETKKNICIKSKTDYFLFYNALFADDFKKTVAKYLDISLFERDKERIYMETYCTTPFQINCETREWNREENSKPILMSTGSG